MITCLECGKKLNAIKHSHLRFQCSGLLSNVKEYKQKYPTAKTVSEEISKKCTHTLENMIIRYGEVDGKLRWDTYCKKQSKTCSFEYFAETRGWSKEQFDEYNQSRAVTLDNMIIRHGEELGHKKWEEYCKRQSYAGVTLEYYIDNFGEEDGTIRFIEMNKSKGITLENFIKKYGIEEGTRRFEQALNNKSGFVSNLSNKIVETLAKNLPNDWIFHEGFYGKEFCIYKDRPYFYDFVITFPIKACIEINGDYWHANPSIYNENDSIQYPNRFRLAKDIWEFDKAKNNLIKERGYEIFIIWEKTYNENPQQTIQETLEWLNSLEKKLLM